MDYFNYTQLTRIVLATPQVVDRAVARDYKISSHYSHNKGNDHRKDVQVGSHHTLVPGQLDVTLLIRYLTLNVCK